MMKDIPLKVPVLPTMIRVFCIKPMQFIHRHPHLMEVPGQDDKPHLGQPHEHRVNVTAYMLCEHLQRDKDLLLLHHATELATEFPKRVNLDVCSFEQVCLYLRDRIESAAHIARIYAIKIEAHDEGAEIIWGERLPSEFPISASPLPEFLKKRQ